MLEQEEDMQADHPFSSAFMLWSSGLEDIGH
jgi:hypothetical protein